MPEQITTKYQPLFEIRLLHHYWLDEGATLFDILGDQSEKEARLLTYDVRRIFRITPTHSTNDSLRGVGGLFRETTLGCVVAAPTNQQIPFGGVLEFVVTVQDSNVLNYTALTLRPQKIYEIFNEPEKRVYRYKENVPLLSNLTGVVRATGPAQGLYLSREIPAIALDDQVEALGVSERALVQLTADMPGSGTQQIGAAVLDCAVFVHQGDVPTITPPVGLTDAPERGILLSDDVPDAVFALIRLVPRHLDQEGFSFVDAEGRAKSPHPIFQVRLKSRSTIRRYWKKTTGNLISSESDPLPMTRFGNAGAKEKPSGSAVKPMKTGSRITQLVSDIFI